MINWLKHRLWAWRIRKCWKMADHDTGQFYSNVGYFVARGFLPKSILEDAGEL